MTKDEKLEAVCEEFAVGLANYFREEWLAEVLTEASDDSLKDYVKTFLVASPEDWILGKVLSYLPEK